jgi:hypothetical protein
VPISRNIALQGRVVAGAFGAFESFGLDRNHRNTFFLGHTFAYGFEVVSDNPHNAGRVHKSGVGLMPVNEFNKRLIKFGLASEDHVFFLEIGGETQPVQRRAGRQGPANVPCVCGATYGAVNQVQSVRYRVENDPRTAKHARPLADRAGEAVFVAGHLKRLIALPIYLILSFRKNWCSHLLNPFENPVAATGRPTSR